MAKGYGRFETVVEAEHAYRRCRKPQWFILSDAGATAHQCARCGVNLAPEAQRASGQHAGYDGNRCVYSPRHRRTVTLCYVCSWETLFADLFRLADRMAGAPIRVPTNEPSLLNL